MKVLFVSKSYEPVIGGVETVVRQLAEGVAASGDAATVLTCHAEALRPLVRETLRGVDVIRVPTLGTRFSTPLAPSFPLHLRGAVADSDLVHLQIPFPVGEAALAIVGCELQTKPLVVTFHADPKLSRWGALLELYRPLFTRVLRRAAHVVVTAPQNLESSPSLSPFAEKVRVIPLAPDDHAGSGEAETRAVELRRELALEGAPVVLYLGRLAQYKGIEVLLDAMRELPEARLVIAGEGPLDGALQRKAAASALGGRVRFVGRVPEHEVAAYFELADVFAFPSISASEAFGIVQLEAMRAGVPVVNTSLPTGVPFVSLHGETGLTVQPGDPRALAGALRAILGDRALRERFSANARARAARFTLGRMRDAYRALYEDALARR